MGNNKKRKGRCGKCGEIIDGWNCRFCQNEAVKRYQRRKRDLINEIKLSLGCADCGYAEWPEALDFDHPPDVKKLFNVSQSRSIGWQQILDEIAKCEVVCANCHRHRTKERLP